MLQSKYLLTDVSPCKQGVLYLSWLCGSMCVCNSACTCGIPVMWLHVYVCGCKIMSCYAGQFKGRTQVSAGAHVGVCACVVRLHVIISPQWQVRESDVMRLSSSWFKHEHGKTETEREKERISLVSWGREIKRDWAYSCVPVYILLQGKSCDKKKKMHFLHLCMHSQTFT